ncbi:MAG: hypothetical protein HQ541_12500, partial [Mariniphaga sp.]|nr:hypothetical protein [Mariniphaga sp.]
MSEDREITKKIQEIISLRFKDVNVTEKERSRIISEAFSQTIDETAKEIHYSIKKGIPKMIRETNKIHTRHHKKLNIIWKTPLDMLEALWIIAIEIGQDFNERNYKKVIKDNDLTLFILTRLHCQACQIVGEIITLLRNGYADGANARWRSLFETVVTALFINKQGKETAERYLAHEIIDKYKRMNEMHKYLEELNIEPVPDKEIEILKEERKQLIIKYGKSFKGSYGWAAYALDKNRPNYRDIEEAIGLNYLRPYYQLANIPVHAGPMSILFDLGMPETDILMLAGSSNRGLADPGQ